MSILTSKQDADQVLRLAFDDATKSIRTSGGGSGGTTTVIQPDGSQLHVTVDQSALPAGAATSAKQDSQITQLNNIQTTSGETATNTLATSSTLSALSAKTASALVTVPFDNLSVTYVGSTSDINTVTYKSGVTTVATLTMGYDGQGRLTTVVRT